MAESEQDRGAHDAAEEPRTTSTQRLPEPRQQVAAVGELLPERGQGPAEHKEPDQHPQVALEPVERAQVLLLARQVVRDGHRHAELEHRPESGEREHLQDEVTPALPVQAQRSEALATDEQG